MDKRSFFAWGLIAAIWILWMQYFAPQPPPPRPSSQAPVAVATATPTPTSAPATPPPAMAKKAAAVTLRPAAALGKKEKEEEQRLAIDTPLIQAELSTWGGGFVHYRLKKYFAERGAKGEPIDIFPAADFEGYTPQWRFVVDGVEMTDGGLYRVIEGGPKQYILEREIAAGLLLRKTLALADRPYFFDYKVELLASSASAISRQVQAKAVLPVTFEPSRSSFFGASTIGTRGVLLANEKIKRFDFTAKEFKPFETPGLGFAGIDTHYFLNAYVPKVGLPQSWLISAAAPGTGKPDYWINLSFLPQTVKTEGPAAWVSNLYIGPKRIQDLQAVSASLERTIDLGDWLGPIARPMLIFLNWLYAYIGNYGIAIIILTVLVRLLLNPLNAIQIKQSKRMQMLQPELAAIKEKYKGDKMRQQQETMQLFKRHKVNPMGGCLPMLVQIPIFIALYRVLYNAIELRHAPFFLWITDLSAKDPYYITPILLGVVMYLQQKLTPAIGDPAQQAALKFMPIMFTVFMLWLPSGLVLYFFFSTLLGVIQQWRLMKQPMTA